MLRLILSTLVLSLTNLTAAPSAAAEPAADSDRLKQLLQEYERVFERPMRELPAALRPVYMALFGKMASSVAILPTGDLRQLSEATEFMASIDGDSHFREIYRSTVDELIRRDEIEDADLQRLHNNLVDWRDFAEARAIRRQHSAIAFKVPPEVVSGSHEADSSGHWVYEIDATHHRIIETPLKFAKGIHVVALIHPGCPHSRRAITALSEDVELRAAIAGNVTWLSSPDSIRHFPHFQEWNRAHPDFQIVVPVDPWGWDFIDVWGFPIFLVLDDGKLVEQWQGWPADNTTHDKLRELFAQRTQK